MANKIKKKDKILKESETDRTANDRGVTSTDLLYEKISQIEIRSNRLRLQAQALLNEDVDVPEELEEILKYPTLEISSKCQKICLCFLYDPVGTES